MAGASGIGSNISTGSNPIQQNAAAAKTRVSGDAPRSEQGASGSGAGSTHREEDTFEGQSARSAAPRGRGRSSASSSSLSVASEDADDGVHAVAARAGKGKAAATPSEGSQAGPSAAAEGGPQGEGASAAAPAGAASAPAQGADPATADVPAQGAAPAPNALPPVAPAPSLGETYRSAVRRARREISHNPIGRLDDWCLAPKTWDKRQQKLNDQGAYKCVLVCEGVRVSQDILAPAYYVLNKVFGNGRAQPSFFRSVDGELAGAERCAGGLVPSIAGLFTYLGALAGTCVGKALDFRTGRQDAGTCALWGARIGAVVTCAVTQASVGFNLALKSVLAVQPGLGVTVPVAAFFLAVGWAMLRFAQAVGNLPRDAEGPVVPTQNQPAAVMEEPAPAAAADRLAAAAGPAPQEIQPVVPWA